MKYKVTNIDWDIDYDPEYDGTYEEALAECGLPTETILDMNTDEEIADVLSDIYGYLVKSYSID